MRRRELACIALLFVAASSCVALAVSIALVHPLIGIAAAAVALTTMFVLAVVGVVKEPKFTEAPQTLALLLVAVARSAVVAARNPAGRSFHLYLATAILFSGTCLALGPGSVRQYDLLCTTENGTIFGWLMKPTSCTSSGTTVYAYVPLGFAIAPAHPPLKVVGAQGRELFCHPQSDDVGISSLVCEPQPPCIRFEQSDEQRDAAPLAAAGASSAAESGCVQAQGALCLSLAQGGSEVHHYLFPFKQRGVTVCPAAFVPEQRRAEIANSEYIKIDPKDVLTFVVYCSGDSGKWKPMEPKHFRVRYGPDTVRFGRCASSLQ